MNERQDQDDLPVVLSFSEFRALAHQEPRGELWKGILPQTGLVLFAGDPLSGKTLVMIALGIAMSGAGILCGLPVQLGTMLLCALEHTKSSVEQLVQLIWLQQSCDPNIYFITKLDLDDNRHIDKINEEANKINARVIVIDSLRRASRYDENRTQDTSELGKRLFKLTNNNKRLVIVIHHFSRNGKIRGSTDLEAMADSVLTLTRKKKDIIQIEAKHHDNEKTVTQIKFIIKDGEFIFEKMEKENAAKQLTGILQETIYNLCQDKPCTTREVREGVRRAGLTASHQTIDEQIEKMVAAGQLEDKSPTKQKRQWAAK